jgi:hypothetical protein
MRNFAPRAVLAATISLGKDPSSVDAIGTFSY